MPQVHLSDKVQAVKALANEMDLLEQAQLKLGREIDELIQKQAALAKKSGALSIAMDKLVCGGYHGTLQNHLYNRKAFHYTMVFGN